MDDLNKIVLDEINEKGEVLVSDLIMKTKLDIETLLSILIDLENNNKIILDYEEKDIMKTLILNNESYLDKFNLDLHNKTIETKKRVDLEREIK
jgi:Cft2 family RNA processing exonuclease